jgi:DNA repair protein RAD57
MASRSTALIKLGYLLRKLAREEDVAVVVANQVSDRFEGAARARAGQDDTARSSSPLTASFSSPAPQVPWLGRGQSGNRWGEEVLSLDHQQKFFTGWGDEADGMENSAGLKTPALGLVWTNQIACRIALKISSTPNRMRAADSEKSVSRAGKDMEHNTETGRLKAIPTSQESYIWNERKKKRIMRVVFAPWVAGSKNQQSGAEGPEFQILGGGIRSVSG